MDRIRIVLGEDHALVREGTRQILSQHPDLDVVGEAADGQGVLALVTRLQPDVTLLDIRMPGLSAIEATRRLTAIAPATRTLILTAHDDDDLVVAAMEAGAAGYLLKTVRAGELVQAVRAVCRGETVLHPAIARKIALMWARRRSGPETAETLTGREKEVLQFVSRGLRNKEIAQELSVSIRTVEGHLSSILSKLGVTTRTAAVVQAAAQNWVQLKGQERER